MKEFELKYGCNPNQKPAKIYIIIVDAGIGRPSQACEAMEMGASAVMANTSPFIFNGIFTLLFVGINQKTTLTEPPPWRTQQRN